MKILHTSDWHLGRALYQRKHYAAFAAFLDWLVQTIAERHIDVVLIAGDVFDNSMPSNHAQALYYQFLQQAAQQGCQHIVIIGGNHDSATFLNAPQILLKTLNIHVVGAVSETLSDEVLVLHDRQHQPALIVCAVPYLREKDVRTVTAGESVAQKSENLTHGIKQHYDNVCQIALQKQRAFPEPLPIIAMGHLFATGGQTTPDDGVRELYVGSLARVTEQTFNPAFRYVALGHLHRAQHVGQTAHIRYAGSPLPMGFGEAEQTKKMIEITLTAHTMTMDEITVPCFQRLKQIRGDYQHIADTLAQLRQEACDIWLEIYYTGGEIIGDLSEKLNHLVEDSLLTIFRVFNASATQHVLTAINKHEQLHELDVNDVFKRCLACFDVPSAQQSALISAYQEILDTLTATDSTVESPK